MSIDYEVLRRRPEAGQMDLLLVAAKKDEINDYAAIVREAKLKPVIVDINAFTIQNIFEYQHGLPEDGTIALLNVGAAVSSLNIVSHGVSRVHARDHQRRQLDHRGDPEAVQRARSSRPRPTSAAAGRREIVPQEVHQIIQQRVRRARRRDPALARLLPRDERRDGDQPHLRLAAAARTSRRSASRSRSARACRCRSSTRWRTSPSTRST